MKQQLPKKFLLSVLALPLLLGTLTSAPAVAEEPLPTEAIAATPSPDPSESVSPTPGPETSQDPTADPTNSPTTSPDSTATPSPSQSPEPSASASPTNEALPEEQQEEFSLIVTFEISTSEAKQEDIVESLESASLAEVSDITSSTSVIVASGDMKDAINELRETPGVKAVSEDKVKTFARTPNDPNFSQQWYLRPWQPGSSRYGINAEAAWDKTQGSEDAIVAVLDTGKIDHPDLVGKWLPGWDFVDDDSNPTDPGLTPGDTDPSGWHGTTIAGVIAGATNNGLGIAGINWNTKILPVRVGSGDGASDSDLIAGIRWAAGLSVAGTTLNPNPAKVINISWGGEDSCSTAYQDAINAATAAGSLVVVAAGNGDGYGNAEDADFVSPANCQKVLTVSASNSSGMKTNWANYGDVVDVLAPGDSVYTTSCGNYYTCSGNYNYENVAGTSFAAPIAAAVASLALSINPSLTPAELETLIKSSTNQRAGYSCAGGCGTGVIDAYKVVNSLNGIWNTSDSDLIATLPLNDGFQDQVILQFDSTSGSAATLALLKSDGAPTSVGNWSVTPTQLPALTYRGTSSVSLNGLPADNYLIRIAQDQNSIDVPLLIGTGILHSISISKSVNAVYPFRDGYLDSATITVTGRDVQGNIIPVIGGVALNKVNVPLSLTKSTATWNWAAIPKGTREIVATGFGPNRTGASQKTARTTIVIGKSVATRASVSTNVSTVYPVKDNYIDTTSISMAIATNTGKIVPGSGTITVFQGKKKVASWKFTHTKLGTAKKTSVSWNGRVSGKVKKGKFKVVATFKSSEDGRTLTATKNINVSDKKRVLKTKKGSWYTAASAWDSCYGTGYRACEYYQSTGVRYYSGSSYSDAIASESSLPFPVNKSAVHSWRIRVNGWSTDADYYLIPCIGNNSASTCSGSDSGAMYFSGNAYVDRTWTSGYTKTGIADGYANWIMLSTDWGSFYAYAYQIEVKYWALV